METKNVLDDILAEAIKKSKEDKKKIVIIEDGGYFADALTKISEEDAACFAGVVEDTTFGHNRYMKVVEKIKIPVFSVARSPLKEIEAIFVGRAAVLAVDSIFRDIGVSIPSRRALVIGYGMIGKNVAFALRANNLNVSIYDKNDHRNLKAFNMGFHIHKKLELIKEADIIFSATGTSAVSIDDIEMCKTDVVLASVGSKDIEFDIKGIHDLSIKTENISDNVVKYTLPSNKTIYVLREGTAVNFLIKSVPTEIIDIVFSEIILCSTLLLSSEKKYLPSSIHTVSESHLNKISKDWLKYINH
jgi:adenosylhomocysteinase